MIHEKRNCQLIFSLRFICYICHLWGFLVEWNVVQIALYKSRMEVSVLWLDRGRSQPQLYWFASCNLHIQTMPNVFAFYSLIPEKKVFNIFQFEHIQALIRLSSFLGIHLQVASILKLRLLDLESKRFRWKAYVNVRVKMCVYMGGDMYMGGALQSRYFVTRTQLFSESQICIFHDEQLECFITREKIYIFLVRK